jgi:hypothetical protein
MSFAMVCAGENSWANKSKPAGPYKGFSSAWLESAPTPRRLYTQSAPTAKNRLAIAMPKNPSSSRAKMDQVIKILCFAVG